MSYRIALVEDELSLNQVLTSYLRNEGWQVEAVTTGKQAQQLLREAGVHLWVLDIMLPDIDGYQLLQEIKERDATVPVVFISARDADIDRVVGLELGSDDYLAKPFLPRELVIRVRRLLERTYRSGSAPKKSETLIIINSYQIDSSRRTVMNAEGQAINLTAKEFDLLEYFANNIGRALEREQVLAEVWGSDYFGTDRVVDDLIRRLRKKMPALSMETIYGYGYRLLKG